MEGVPVPLEIPVNGVPVTEPPSALENAVSEEPLHLEVVCLLKDGKPPLAVTLLPIAPVKYLRDKVLSFTGFHDDFLNLFRGGRLIKSDGVLGELFERGDTRRLFATVGLKRFHDDIMHELLAHARSAALAGALELWDKTQDCAIPHAPLGEKPLGPFQRRWVTMLQSFVAKKTALSLPFMTLVDVDCDGGMDDATYEGPWHCTLALDISDGLYAGKSLYLELHFPTVFRSPLCSFVAVSPELTPFPLYGLDFSAAIDLVTIAHDVYHALSSVQGGEEGGGGGRGGGGE